MQPSPKLSGLREMPAHAGLLGLAPQVGHETCSCSQYSSQGGQLRGSAAQREERQKQDQPSCDDDADRDEAIRHGVISKSCSQLTFAS